MGEDAEKRANKKRAKRRKGEVDRLSNLPDSLIYEVLLKLPSKDVVKTSLLSTKWRNLWKSVPGLDLDYRDFSDQDALVGFVNWFLVNNESYMRNFKLEIDWHEHVEPDFDHLARWINTVVERKVEQFHFSYEGIYEEIEIPPTIYTCKSLVSLKLFFVWLPNPEFVTLPCVKDIKLQMVKFVDDLAFEMLFSGCPVLESLFIERSSYDNLRVLRVCSQSVLSFTFVGHCEEDIENNQVLVIDAPKLEYLKLVDHTTSRFIIQNAGSLTDVFIDIVFNLLAFDHTTSRFIIPYFEPADQPQRNMIRNFLIGISSVKVMNISSHTLEVIYNYSRDERLPLFRDVSTLQADLYHYEWERLPIFLESCPNLKHLSMALNPGEQPISILPGPHCHLPTLESVEIEIEKPLLDDEAVMNLVSYFLENSLILKTLTLLVYPYRKNAKKFLKKFLNIPRLSPSCQVIISGLG